MTARIRTCVGCGEAATHATLVRLRVDEGARVVANETTRGGRGAWLHAGTACLARALQRGAFARAFRRGDLVVDGDALRRVLTSGSNED